MKKISIAAILLFIGNILFAQHQEVPENPEMWKGQHNIVKDSNKKKIELIFMIVWI